MTGLTTDLREEGLALFKLLSNKPDAFWHVKTQFKDWTVWDVIAHLHFSDHLAMTTARSAEDFDTLSTDLMVHFQKGLGLKEYARSWLGSVSGPDLFVRWRTTFLQMCDLFDELPSGVRLKWFGPDMGVRMFATARQMETWAHGQALYDLLGVNREDTDRIKNIVVIGVKTFAFAHKNRGLNVPDTVPTLRLVAPSDDIWDFEGEGAGGMISGSAVEFAQVVTQTRNIADTNLTLEGNVAQNWMQIAQCFAGAPENPPAAETRFSNKRPIKF